MKLSISNIAWSEKYDQMMYKFIKDLGINSIEIAPSRFVPTDTYLDQEVLIEKIRYVSNKNSLEVVSFQSILYGYTEEIFLDDKVSDKYLNIIKKCIDISSLLKCSNIVFGSPKLRNIYSKNDYNRAVNFFSSIGLYCVSKDVYISIEPNPTIYGTNFLNTTQQCFEFVKILDSPKIKMNLDIGTIIENKEELGNIYKYIDFVNHVHISAPNLDYIKYGRIHKELKSIFKDLDYNGYMSIEMKKHNNIDLTKNCIKSFFYNFLYE